MRRRIHLDEQQAIQIGMKEKSEFKKAGSEIYCNWSGSRLQIGYPGDVEAASSGSHFRLPPKGRQHG